MIAFGTYVSTISSRLARALTIVRSGGRRLMAEDKVPREAVESTITAVPSISSKRPRLYVDAMYVITMIAAIGGFAIVGRDIAALHGIPATGTLPHHKSSSRSGGEPSDLNGRGESDMASRQDGTPPGSFAAPTRAGDWAEAIASCTRRGPSIQTFVRSFQGTPAQRIASIYVWIAQHWQYEADRDHDIFTPAETLIASKAFRGDCKGIAIVLAASANELGIANRMVATRGVTGAAGHTRTEILICGRGEDPMPVVRTMTAVWNSAGQGTEGGNADLPLALTDEGWFFALDGGPPPKRVDGLGPVEIVVSSTGHAGKER